MRTEFQKNRQEQQVDDRNTAVKRESSIYLPEGIRTREAMKTTNNDENF